MFLLFVTKAVVNKQAELQIACLATVFVRLAIPLRRF